MHEKVPSIKTPDSQKLFYFLPMHKITLENGVETQVQHSCTVRGRRWKRMNSTPCETPNTGDRLVFVSYRPASASASAFPSCTAGAKSPNSAGLVFYFICKIAMMLDSQCVIRIKMKTVYKKNRIQVLTLGRRHWKLYLPSSHHRLLHAHHCSL